MPSSKPAPRPRRKRPAAAGGLPTAKEAAQHRRALGIFLRQTREFRLALALYNDPVQRASLIRDLTAELERDSVAVLTLDLLTPSDQPTLLARVQETVRNAGPGRAIAVMVVNLESRTDYSPELSRPGSPPDTFLTTANLHRELFATACPGPLVLWMTELLERAIVTQAPDLWHWRSHVFDLRTRPKPAPSPLERDGKRLRSDDDRLHPEHRLQRLEEELAAYRQAGDHTAEMRTLNAIGLARLDCGDARLAAKDFREVLRLARENGERRWEGAALGNLGNAHADLGDARKAIEYHEQALVVSREIGDRRAEGSILGNLGLAHADLGDARKAIEFHEQALVVSREIGDRRGEGNDLGNLGIAHADLGDARKAIEFYERWLVIAREIGDRRGEANALFNSAHALAKLGQRGEARGRAEQAAEIYAAIESPWAEKARRLADSLRGEA